MAKITRLALSREAAARILRKLAEDSCKVTLIDECSHSAWERAVATRQIYRCLEAGEVLSDPRFNSETGYWECRMGRFAAGQDIVITVALNRDRTELIVVNVCDETD